MFRDGEELDLTGGVDSAEFVRMGRDEASEPDAEIMRLTAEAAALRGRLEVVEGERDAVFAELRRILTM